MSVRLALVAITAMTVANAAMLAVNLSTSVQAKVAGMDSYRLSNDYDFKSAVERIVEDCKVDGEDISC